MLGPIPPENHTLFDDRSANVYIPIVRGSSTSTSSRDSKLVSIFPFSESETVDEIVNLTITLHTEYPEVWQKLFNGSTNTNVTAYVSGNEIKINSTEIDKIYLPVIDDVISSDLYVGVITATATLGGGLWVSGEGTDIMAMGSRVANVPSSDSATAIVVQDIIIDESILTKLDDDFITITVTDNNWNWWKVLIEFTYKQPQKTITGLVVTNKDGSSNYYYNGNPVASGNPLPFTQSTVIDLFNSLNFDSTDGLYQNASVGSDNRLVTNVADENNQKFLALISFRLLFDGV